MIIITYFDEGPGTGEIKKLASNIVQSAAERVGINQNNLDRIAIAYPENYGKAVQDLTGGLYTTEVSPFFQKFLDHTNYLFLKKLLVGTKNEFQFLCQYFLLFQLVTLIYCL